uniref:E3 ubiquitin-protein ligase n=1 Tax=Cyprinodon variegatus TaxID=28743 RepID=A0A3Q2EKM9_CYPVA
MLLASAVVVWEWLNEHGRWRPYSPAVSHQIEAAIRSSDPRGGSVVLGQVDSRLSPYIIDLQSMHQFRQDTGTIRPVRRTFYDPASAPGQGWQWEWENDAGTWTPYDMEVAIAIESAHSRQQTCLDLTPLGFCYLIDFKNMTQVNRQSQRCRRIQRRADIAYPLVSGPLPVPKGGGVGGGGGLTGALLGPCSCQQCMLVLSVKSNAGGAGGGAAAIQTLSRRPQRSASTTVCHAPLPQRSSLAGLSRPALQRIAMAQSRSLIASGVPTVPVKNLNGSSPVHPALAGITGILMSAAALPVCLTRPPKLVLHPPPVSKSDIKPVPGFNHCCRKTTKKQVRKGKTPEEVVKKYLQKVKSPPEEDCTICMEPLGGPSGYKGPGVGPVSKAESVGRLAQCGHQYHFQCLVAMYNNGNKDGSLQCPTCKTIYGVKTGNQPAGKMEYHVIPHSLPGHPDCKTIRIIYNIPPGIQGPEHPNPGKPFTARGFPRHCYLPDSERGRKVLRLLLVAWDRRLIFSVGTSSTTGESDTVIWNEVHHKTEFGSNLTGHGFPDPGHLDNVLEELRAQGITEEDALVEK